ncbi:hypothetical protein NM688_g2906 [Phlebia brevispora]|uniref:Uncharacterized protein n=1 Tax=Phlebia brevispora TaxID=194682 RepID=A0ACC1T7G9_9APHY|nr:hypothetical protein NM688_g2906 [Phlebia brevispora]
MLDTPWNHLATKVYVEIVCVTLLDSPIFGALFCLTLMVAGAAVTTASIEGDGESEDDERGLWTVLLIPFG